MNTNKAQHLILTVGISASGKSTWTKNKLVYDKYREVNRDDIRSEFAPTLHSGDCKMYYEAPNLREMEDEVTKIQWYWINNYINDGYHVIISDTNLSEYIRNKFIKYAKEKGLYLEYEVFNIDLNLALEYDSNRERKVGKEVIMKQYRSFIRFLRRKDDELETFRSGIENNANEN